MKTKTKVYIDFEAISRPMLYSLPKRIWEHWKKARKECIPYCFSIGFKKNDNENIVDFFIINYQNFYSVQKTYKEIGDSIKTWLKENNLDFNFVEFVGFDPNLENSIFQDIFTNKKVHGTIWDQENIGIKKLTSFLVPKNNYFEKTIKIIELNDEKIQYGAGYIANFVGLYYVLFNLKIVSPKKEAELAQKISKNEYDILLEELINYSKDDVFRLIAISGKDHYLHKIRKHVKYVEISLNILNLELNKLKYLSGFMEQNNPTIEEILNYQFPKNFHENYFQMLKINDEINIKLLNKIQEETSKNIYEMKINDLENVVKKIKMKFNNEKGAII